MNKNCQEFSNASDYIYNWFEKKPNVKEESFTDWFLFYLSENLPAFNFVEFSRDEEGKTTGADFDFWIISRTEYLSLRIQAKKLQKNGNHYRPITYPKKTRNQINLLIASSTFPLRPFYLFYNNDINSSICPLRNSGTILSDAHDLNKMVVSGQKKINRQNILDISVPLECLFCCPLSDDSGENLDGIKSFLETYFPLNDSNTNSGFSDRLPPYIELILRKGISDQELLMEFNGIIPKDVKRIVVLDLRKES